jgi:ribosome-associated toxin RatA of RatAB toxin-antitoxin module
MPGSVALALLVALPLTAGADALAEPPCVGCRADLALVRASLGADAWDALLRGEVVVSEAADDPEAADEGRTVQSAARVERAAREVWAVLLDVEHHRDFLPNVHRTRVRRVQGNRIFISQHLKVLMMDVRFGVVWTVDPERGDVAFALDETEENDVAAVRGSWWVVPLGAPSDTLVRYRAAIDTGRPVPAPVQHLLTRRSLPRVVESLRDEVYRRYPVAH